MAIKTMTDWVSQPMLCENCGTEIDQETDQHLVVIERIVSPRTGFVGAENQVFCSDCMNPEFATLKKSQ